MIITYTICQYTSRLYVKVANNDEYDFSFTVERVLGKIWAKFMAFISCFILFIVSTIYFLLICSIGYPLVTFIMDKTGNSESYHHEVDDITWNVFSI